MNTLIRQAATLPLRPPAQTISINRVALDMPGRGQPFEMRITLPMEGKDLPVILLSHGGGPSLYLSSKDGYGPLANFYAEQGFAVIQPTHASSRSGGLGPDAPGAPLFLRLRAAEMSAILDGLDDIEAAHPLLAGRFDRNAIAAVGHSLGGMTVGMLLGARFTDPKEGDDRAVDMREPRIKAGVLLAAPGRGGEDLSDYARANFPELNPDYSTLTTPAMVVVGDADLNPYITRRGPEWYRAAFEDGPGATMLLTLHGGQHGLGGIAGFDAKETSDEDPDRLATVQRLTSAWLHSALSGADTEWQGVLAVLRRDAGDLAKVETK